MPAVGRPPGTGDTSSSPSGAFVAPVGEGTAGTAQGTHCKAELSLGHLSPCSGSGGQGAAPSSSTGT